MKQICLFINRITLFVAAFFLSLATFAQNDTKKIDVNINTKSNSDSFFTQPWVWVVAGAVFILLLVALMRGNSKSE